MDEPRSVAPRVLVVEDDAQLCAMLVELVGDAGYVVDDAADGSHALRLGLTRRYDVILLDRRLPTMDGLTVIARLRREGVETPVLVLSAAATPAERVTGLDAGAEDYLVKPFDIDELLARLRALRRRHHGTTHALAVGPATLDLDARDVVFGPHGAGSVALSDRECALLHLLASHPRQVFTRTELLDLVFTEAEKPIVVDTYVHYLRRKLGHSVVETIRGRGYRLGHPTRR